MTQLETVRRCVVSTRTTAGREAEDEDQHYELRELLDDPVIILPAWPATCGMVRSLLRSDH